MKKSENRYSELDKSDESEKFSFRFFMNPKNQKHQKELWKNRKSELDKSDKSDKFSFRFILKESEKSEKSEKQKENLKK